MRIPEHYAADVLFFFDGHPEELALYEALFRAVEEAFPEGSVRVQKTQISFYGRHLFAAASLPVRRRKDWPKICPGRWTHHILVTEAGQIDEELMGWLREAWDFAESKR